jgi:RNA polymerase sigma-70 factor (ECF subfamily)
LRALSKVRMVALGRITSPVLARACEANARSQQLANLFAQHAAFVWRSLRRMGVAAADLEDATQEVFVVVHKRLEEYEERASIRSWLYAICLRVSSRQRRTTSRRREQVVAEPPELSVEPGQLADVEQRESLRLGQSLLAALPEKQRTVFVLYEVEHMTVAEIAEALGCPLQTAYARLHKARERVRAELSRARALGRVP